MRKFAKYLAHFIQPYLIIMNDGDAMDGDQVEEFSVMLQEEINKLMANN